MNDENKQMLHGKTVKQEISTGNNQYWPAYNWNKDIFFGQNTFLFDPSQNFRPIGSFTVQREPQTVKICTLGLLVFWETFPKAPEKFRD